MLARIRGFPSLGAWACALLIGAACALLYDPWRMENSSGDTIGHRYIPVSILEHGDWTLNPFRKDFERVKFAGVRGPQGDLLLRGGWAMLLLTVPFYAMVDAIAPPSQGWTHNRINQVSRWNAILIAVCGVLAMFSILARLVPLPAAVAATLLFAFGTWQLSMGPQGLYTQAAAVLMHLLSIRALLAFCGCGGRDWKGIALAAILGFLHALVWSLRPIDFTLLLPVPLLLFALWLGKAEGFSRIRAPLVAYGLTFLAIVLPLMVIDYRFFGTPLGFYAYVEAKEKMNTFRFTFSQGFLGLLFSPNRGAIVFFPLLFLVPLFWRRLLYPVTLSWLLFGKGAKSSGLPASRAGVHSQFMLALARGGFLYFLVLSIVDYWHGTWGYGPRYLYNLMPYIWPAIAFAVDDTGRFILRRKHLLPAWVSLFSIVMAGVCVFVHVLGHRNYDLYVWNGIVPQPIDNASAWNTRELMLEHVWRAGSNKKRWDDSYARILRYGW